MQINFEIAEQRWKAIRIFDLLRYVMRVRDAQLVGAPAPVKIGTEEPFGMFFRHGDGPAVNQYGQSPGMRLERTHLPSRRRFVGA